MKQANTVQQRNNPASAAFKKATTLTVWGLVLLLFSSYTAFSQITYFWNQTGTGDWTVASNWTPARTTPAANDILNFNGGGTITVTNMPTQTIGQLNVLNNSIVNLKAGAMGTVLTVNGGSGTTGDDFIITAGGQLNLNDNVNTTTLFIATGATASISGNLIFSWVPHRMDAADAGAITFNAGSMCYQFTGCTGHLFNASGTTNVAVFAFGSLFVQAAGDDPFGFAVPDSKVIFQTGSKFRMQQDAPLDLADRTYGALDIYPPFNQTISGPGSLNVGHINMHSGPATLNINLTGNINVNGDITVVPGCTVGFSSPVPNVVTLSGNSLQTIINYGTLNFGNNTAVNVNNSAGVTLFPNSPVTINNTLTLTAGNVILDINDLTVNNIAGSFSNTLHVVTNSTGKLYIKNVGTSPVVFPVGGSSVTYNPVTISNGQGFTYGAGVNNTIAPAISNAAYAVNRTWAIAPSVTPVTPVTVSFAYSNSDGNASFNYTAPVDLGQYSTAWNTIQTNIAQTQPVTASISTLTAATSSAFVIANAGAIAPLAWNNASITNSWNDAANWLPNTSYSNWTAASIARFHQAGYYRQIGADFSQGNLSLARITASGTNYTTPNPLDSVVIGNSSNTDGIINLYGDTNGEIMTGSMSHLTFNDNIAGLQGKTTLNIAGAANTIRVYLNKIEINVPVTGNSGLHVRCTGLSGSLILKGACTYTGTTLVDNNGGGSNTHVYLARPGGNTLNPLSNIRLVNSGYLHVQTDQTIHDVYLGLQGWIYMENGATLTITGTLTTYPGRVTGNIKFAPGAKLFYIGSGTTSSAEFPAVDGPTDVRLNWETILNLHAPRTISGTLSAEVGIASFRLGNNNFTAASAVCDNGCNFVVINGSGKLHLRCPNNTAVTFPLKTSSNAASVVTIQNGQNLVYGVGVAEGITPALSTSNTAVNRTWYIQPSATPAAPVDVQFSYSNTDGNAGFNYTDPVDLLQYTSAWNVLQTNIVQSQPLNTTIASLTGGVESIFAIQNATGALATAAIDIAASKQSSSGYISWKFNNSTADVKQITLEKSGDGRLFNTLTPVAVNQAFYTDNHLLAGKNYYRIKVTDVYGRVSYSAIAALLNSEGGFDIISLLPNIVAADMQVSVAASKRTKLTLAVTDAAGRPVIKTVHNLVAGSNMLQVNTVKLAAGIYYITGTTAEGDVKTMRFIKQ